MKRLFIKWLREVCTIEEQEAISGYTVLKLKLNPEDIQSNFVIWLYKREYPDKNRINKFMIRRWFSKLQDGKFMGNLKIQVVHP